MRGLDVIDAECECPLHAVPASVDGRSRQLVAWSVPTVREAHAAQGDDAERLLAAPETAVLHRRAFAASFNRYERRHLALSVSALTRPREVEFRGP